MEKTCTVLLSNSLGRWQEPGETRAACGSRQTSQDSSTEIACARRGLSADDRRAQWWSRGKRHTHLTDALWTARTAHCCSHILFCSASRDRLCSLYASFAVAQSWHKNIERVANPEETQQKKKKTHSDHTSDLPYICCIGVVTSSTPFLLWKVSGVGLCRPNNLVSIGIRDIYKDLFINIHY